MIQSKSFWNDGLTNIVKQILISYLYILFMYLTCKLSCSNVKAQLGSTNFCEGCLIL